MNYHIMVNDKFIDGFINDAEKVSKSNKNRYFIRGPKSNPVYVHHPLAEWVDVVSNEFKETLRGITVNDKIIVHWYDLLISNMLLEINKEIPIYVAYWGGEFFEEPYLFHMDWAYDNLTRKFVIQNLFFGEKWPKHPIRIIKKTCSLLNYKRIALNQFEQKKKAVRRINYLLMDSVVFKGDYEKILEIYELDRINCLPFIYDLNVDKAIELAKKKPLKKNIVIQIGNSATESNNHIECLYALKKFNSYDIKITIPLSYGNMKYSKYVKQYGKRIIGEKCECVENFLPRDEYVKNLNNIDIAIMYHNRSQAFGNIITLLMLGKKVFIKSHNTLWKLFQNIGIIIFDANIINELSFEEFTKPLAENQIQSNIEKISNLFSEEKRLEYLSKILN